MILRILVLTDLDLMCGIVIKKTETEIKPMSHDLSSYTVFILNLQV